VSGAAWSPPTARKSATGQTRTRAGAAGSHESAVRELALPRLAVSRGQNLQGGEIFGFPGPGGAGKTPTLRMLRTLLAIGSGWSSQVMTTTWGRKKPDGNSLTRPARPAHTLLLPTTDPRLFDVTGLRPELQPQ